MYHYYSYLAPKELMSILTFWAPDLYYSYGCMVCLLHVHVHVYMFMVYSTPTPKMCRSIAYDHDLRDALLIVYVALQECERVVLLVTIYGYVITLCCILLI